jgi:hypothetical protein
MNHSPAEPLSKPATAGAPLRRRGMLFGVGVTVAAGAVAAVASRTLQAADPDPAPLAKKDEVADGYRLSAHVQRYYETTRV